MNLSVEVFPSWDVAEAFVSGIYFAADLEKISPHVPHELYGPWPLEQEPEPDCWPHVVYVHNHRGERDDICPLCGDPLGMRERIYLRRLLEDVKGPDGEVLAPSGCLVSIETPEPPYCYVYRMDIEEDTFLVHEDDLARVYFEDDLGDEIIVYDFSTTPPTRLP